MKSLIRSTAFLALVLGVDPVQAGSKGSYPVVVDTTQRRAYGSMGSARNSADTVQYIGCQIAMVTASYAQVTCAARDEKNRSGTCTSTAASAVAVVQGMTSASYLDFRWDVEGYCTSITVANYSFYEPLQ